MGDKYKPRQEKLPRNNVRRGMIMSGTDKSGGPMKDKRDRRQNNPHNDWRQEISQSPEDD